MALSGGDLESWSDCGITVRKMVKKMIDNKLRDGYRYERLRNVCRSM